MPESTTFDRTVTRDRRLAFAEAPRALAELASLLPAAPYLGLAPRGDGHPVLVLPGFGGGDGSTAVIRAYLNGQGFAARPWELGRNLGPAMDDLVPRLAALLESVWRRSGQRRVSLVGWSLGGVHAVAVADRAVHAVRQVVTMGSPLLYSDATTPVYQALRATARSLNGQLLHTPQANGFGLDATIERVRAPITSVFSRSDGVVPWQRSRLNADAAHRDNIEVHSSHLGLGFNPAVLFAIADRLACPEDGFERFHRRGWRALTYPSL